MTALEYPDSAKGPDERCNSNRREPISPRDVAYPERFAVWCGAAWLGGVRHGDLRCGVARCGMARSGKARSGAVRQGFSLKEVL